jgi:Lipocalin-like domain
MRYAFLTLALIAQMIATAAAEDELYGTYALVRTTFKLIDTGQEEVIPNERGFITYTREGRMFVVIVRGERPKPESVAKMSDQQRADLFRSMTAYTGKFKSTEKSSNTISTSHGTKFGPGQNKSGTREGRVIRSF